MKEKILQMVENVIETKQKELENDMRVIRSHMENMIQKMELYPYWASLILKDIRTIHRMLEDAVKLEHQLASYRHIRHSIADFPAKED